MKRSHRMNFFNDSSDYKEEADGTNYGWFD